MWASTIALLLLRPVVTHHVVRFPNCRECHSSSKWVGKPDYAPWRKELPAGLTNADYNFEHDAEEDGDDGNNLHTYLTRHSTVGLLKCF